MARDHDRSGKGSVFIIDHADIEKRGIRRQAIKELIRFLSANTRSPEEIGKRVAAFRFLLLADTDCETQSDLASELGFSRQRASAVIDRIDKKLSEIVGDSDPGR